VEPTEAINQLELVLRDLVRSVMGDSWQKQSGINLQKLEGARDADSAKRRGRISSEDLLAYMEFYELKEVILKNWDLFAPALGKKKYVEVYLDRMEGFRNPAVHSRSLLPFERSFVEGIVGEFRNLVTMYRSSRGPDMNYYPQIESVTDSFGRVVTPSTPTQGAPIQQRNEIRLQVGYTVTFRCRGIDPHGRELVWVLHGTPGTWPEAVGNDVALEWQVTNSCVREAFVITIQMLSRGRYHRHGSFDDSVQFPYAVDPPLDS
jgi:hypothetical protein